MKLASAVLALVVAVGLVGFVGAEEKEAKEVTLEGVITCPKCDLKIADACGTVVKVKKDGKDVIYWFDKDSNKKYHGEICTDAKEGKVTGKVTKDGDKWVISGAKVTFK